MGCGEHWAKTVPPESDEAVAGSDHCPSRRRSDDDPVRLYLLDEAQGTGTIEDMANELKKRGLVESLTITDAQGNANTQIQQIQSMIDAKLDAIIVDAGSATALDRVIADACAKGIAVANFDSLVDTNDLTTKIDTDQNEWGKLAAEWLVKQLNGKGNILVLNGPAGVSVSDDRRKGGHQDPRGDQYRVQRRARAGGRHQSAVQQSSDR